MKTIRIPSAKKDSGFALFIVLSFLMVAAAITIPFLANARIEALVSRNTGQLTRDKILLRGILQVAALRYYELQRQAQGRPPRGVDCNFAGLILSIDFQDHSGLIDLNAASVDVLALGLLSFDISTEAAAKLADKIVKYRSIDGLAPAEPAGFNVRNGYKNALFENVSELYDLNSAAGVSFRNIDEIFTVYSGAGTLDETAVPKRLMTIIEKIPVTDRYFIVNDTGRINAVTVSATIKRRASPLTSAKAILGRGQNDQGIVFLGPMNLARMSDGASDRNRGEVVVCEGFFDRQLLQVLAQAVS